MVDRELAFSALQLIALSLPAFAIFLQIVVQSDMPYTEYAVPITTVGMGLFLTAGGIFLGRLLFAAASVPTQLALGFILLGMLCLIIGGSLIGWQTAKKQHRLQNSD